MTRSILSRAAALTLAATAVAAPALAADHAPNIVGVAAGNPDFSTLVTAVKAAGLVDTLSGPGPFTVFAPNNAAFAKLPAGTVETLVKPENKPTLTKILTCHVVAGKVVAKDLLAAIKANGGAYTIKTVGGCQFKAAVKAGKVVITDEKGGQSTVAATDVAASNGVIHVIDSVLMPR
ncbi:fasciclin domain-containing protein [uncultured Caulobacter sp.]|uniref:fasciclin domain-containing protein n=1 Tax=uncultured Caulobacter sp. TaxID=158749 RepID=UPI00260EAF5C|nr:fasciclin domain-containing protein [uncultured Caulobacter sp.]